MTHKKHKFPSWKSFLINYSTFDVILFIVNFPKKVFWSFKTMCNKNMDSFYLLYFYGKLYMIPKNIQSKASWFFRSMSYSNLVDRQKMRSIGDNLIWRQDHYLALLLHGNGEARLGMYMLLTSD